MILLIMYILTGKYPISGLCMMNAMIKFIKLFSLICSTQGKKHKADLMS
jgi:hypothetical protein